MLKKLAFAVLAVGAVLAFAPAKASAQVGFGVTVGPPAHAVSAARPVCAPTARGRGHGRAHGPNTAYRRRRDACGAWRREAHQAGDVGDVARDERFGRARIELEACGIDEHEPPGPTSRLRRQRR